MGEPSHGRADALGRGCAGGRCRVPQPQISGDSGRCRLMPPVNLRRDDGGIRTRRPLTRRADWRGEHRPHGSHPQPELPEC